MRIPKVIFFRYNKFDNSKCTRELPYEGRSWYVIKSTHYKRLLKYITLPRESSDDERDLNNWEFATLEEMKTKNIMALDYLKANAYVVGESEHIPNLEEFIPSLHTATWRPTQMSLLGYGQYELETLGIPYWIPMNHYQVLIN